MRRRFLRRLRGIARLRRRFHNLNCHIGPAVGGPDCFLAAREMHRRHFSGRSRSKLAWFMSRLTLRPTKTIESRRRTFRRGKLGRSKQRPYRAFACQRTMQFEHLRDRRCNQTLTRCGRWRPRCWEWFWRGRGGLCVGWLRLLRSAGHRLRLLRRCGGRGRRRY